MAQHLFAEMSFVCPQNPYFVPSIVLHVTGSASGFEHKHTDVAQQ
jgi:hypothetical protein